MGNPVEIKKILEKSKLYSILCRYESKTLHLLFMAKLQFDENGYISTYQDESTHEMVSLFSASILAGPIGGPGIPPIIMMLIQIFRAR